MTNPKDEGEDGPLTQIASGAGLVFGGRIVKLTFGFLTQILMAQLLGVAVYGTVVLVMISLRVAGLFSTLGLSGGLERNVPYFEDEPKKARGIIKAAGQIGALSSGLVAILLFMMAPLLAEAIFQDSDFALLLRIAAFALPFQVLRKMSIATAKGSRDAKTHVIIEQILYPPLKTVMVGGLIVAGYKGPGAVAGLVLSNAITSILALYLALGAIKFPIRGPTTLMHRRLLGFSVPLMFSSAMNLLLFEVDTIVVGAFLESASAGVYNVVFQFRSLGMFFFFSFAFLLPPVLTRLEKSDDYLKSLRTYQVTSKWMVFSTLPIIVGFIFFPGLIIERFFGSDYVQGANALRVLMLPILVTVVLGPNGRSLVALGHNKINMWVNGGIGLVNLVLNVFLVPEFGILGAACATATALAARDIVFALVLYRRENIYAISKPMITILFGTTVLTVVGYAVTVPFIQFTFFSALLWGLGFLVVYSFAIVSLGGLEPEDERLVSLLESRVGVEFTPLRRMIARLQ